MIVTTASYYLPDNKGRLQKTDWSKLFKLEFGFTSLNWYWIEGLIDYHHLIYAIDHKYSKLTSTTQNHSIRAAILSQPKQLPYHAP